MAKAKKTAKQCDGSKPLGGYRRERFAREFIVDLNGAQAAIRAGYSHKRASNQAYYLLRQPDVAARVAFLQSKTINGLEIKAENTIRELAKLAYANMDDYMTVQEDGSAVVDLSGTNRDQRAAIQELVVDEYTEGQGEGARDVKRTRIKVHDKRASLVDLGRHQGIFEADNNQQRDVAPVFLIVAPGQPQAQPKREDSPGPVVVVPPSEQAERAERGQKQAECGNPRGKR